MWRAKCPSVMKAVTMAWVSSGLPPAKAWLICSNRSTCGFGHDEIGKPQAGKQHLAEGAGIEHAPVAIQALQRRQRAADIAVFAVIIVLDDPGVVARRPIQQRQAPGQGQGHAERALMRRRDHRGARARRQLDRPRKRPCRRDRPAPGPPRCAYGQAARASADSRGFPARRDRPPSAGHGRSARWCGDSPR